MNEGKCQVQNLKLNQKEIEGDDCAQVHVCGENVFTWSKGNFVELNRYVIYVYMYVCVRACVYSLECLKGHVDVSAIIS